MYVVYAIAVMTIGTYVTDWTNDVLVVAIQDAAASGLQAIGTAAFLEDLIVNGNYRWTGCSTWIPSADGDFVCIALYSGRLWIYGQSCLCHGPYFP